MTLGVPNGPRDLIHDNYLDLITSGSADRRPPGQRHARKTDGRPLNGRPPCRLAHAARLRRPRGRATRPAATRYDERGPAAGR